MISSVQKIAKNPTTFSFQIDQNLKLTPKYYFIALGANVMNTTRTCCTIPTIKIFAKMEKNKQDEVDISKVKLNI